MPSYEEAVALFDRRRILWLAEDLDAYLTLWADSMKFRSPLHDFNSKGEYATLLRQSLLITRPVAFDVLHLAVRDTLVFAEWRGEIEWRDDHRHSIWYGMSTCEIEDGLITDWREYWDPQSFVSG